MAIELITGLPGHGKTLYLLQYVKGIADKSNRPVFHNGIPGLMLPWTKIDTKEWEQLEPGSIVVVDEAQFTFPLRARGQPPEWIEKLATHRHKGIDFYLVTQDPMLIDSFVRRLIDRHWHVVRRFGSRMAVLHEYVNGCRDSVSKSRAGSITHEWRYPAEVFSWYKSAEIHTVKRRIPARVLLLVVLPFVIAGLAWFGWQKAATVGRSEVEPAGSAASGPGLRPGAPQPLMVEGSRREVDRYLARHVPRVPGLEYTAPIYDGLTAPVRAPRPAACVEMGARCGCYSQQGTVLEVPPDLCRSIVRRGIFLAFEDGVGGQGGQKSTGAAASPSRSASQAGGAEPARPARRPG